MTGMIGQCWINLQQLWGLRPYHRVFCGASPLIAGSLLAVLFVND
jgi:hypothetical protein